MNSEAARIEHLKLIQAVVARLGKNSFAIKSTAAAVSAALVAFTASVGSPLASLGGFAILSLWLLDAYFLWKERGFRRLYDSIRKGSPTESGSSDYFRMDVPVAVDRADGLLSVAVSLSLSLFYIPLLILVGVSAGIALS